MVFHPWVSQIYLTLAAFNLAKRNQEEFKNVFSSKLKLFGLLYFFFVIENMIVAPNFGEAISFYPIMSWMVILAMVSVMFRFFGIRGVIFLFALSFLKWLIPDSFENSVGFEFWVQENIHAQYELDAQVNYFLSSGCLGFILGHAYHHKSEWGLKREAFEFGIGFILFMVWVLWGEKFSVNFLDVFESEHDLAEGFLGLLSILGVQLMVLSGFLVCEKKGLKFKVPILHWVGVNSISVFALHRVLFIHVLVPVMMVISNLMSSPLVNNWYICWASAFFVFGFTWFVKKSELAKYHYKINILKRGMNGYQIATYVGRLMVSK